MNLPHIPGHTEEDRAAQIRLIVTDVAERRRRGQPVRDSEVIAAHPELMPELRDELRVMEEIRRAHLAAESAGPLLTPLNALTDSQLDAPIDPQPDDRADLEPDEPLEIAGYVLLEKIGGGGQGTVFKAQQKRTSRYVAVKVFISGALAGAQARSRLDREAEILAALDHPNIVDILDRGRLPGGTFYLVLPLIQGRPLDQFAAELASAPENAVQSIVGLFTKLANAVEAAHAQGIVHRDLKPSNVLVDQRGEPHVLDFGLAKLVEGSLLDSPPFITQTGQLLGSLAWASPEQAAGAGQIDARSDVHALGVMLYQAITGSPPYAVHGPLIEVLENIRSALPTPPGLVLRFAGTKSFRSVSPTLDAIVLKALAKRPHDRYASAGELAQDLENYLAGRPTLAYSQRPRPRNIRWLILFICIMPAAAAALMLLHPWAARPLQTTVFELPNLTDATGIKLVRITPGSFLMGSPLREDGRGDNEAQRLVTLRNAYWISTTEVTRGQYRSIMGTVPPSAEAAVDDLPITNVSWYDASRFCSLLSAREHQTYRLPSEAEWEFACRAGSKGPFAGSGKLDDHGWYAGNSGRRLQPVAQKSSNSWGLFDMHGNAAEWCADIYYQDGPVAPVRYEEPATGSSSNTAFRVIRGGDSSQEVSFCRSASRQSLSPIAHTPWLGFRVVREDSANPASTSRPR